MSSGRALAVGVEGLAGAADKLDIPKGSADAPLCAVRMLLLLEVWPAALGASAPKGSVLLDPKGSELAEAEAVAVPNGSWDTAGAAAGVANAEPKGSLLPKASGAAAGASLDVEKVDQTSAPGDAARTILSVAL